MWVTGAVAAGLLTESLTGQPWLGGIGFAAIILFALWRAVKVLGQVRQALSGAQQERARLEQALRRAQKMAAVGRLTVGVAHDFNNHLTVISSNVEMIARALEPEQDRLLRHVEAAMQGVRQAAMLAGRLLSFSRPPAPAFSGQPAAGFSHQPESEPVDVNRLLCGLVEMLRRTSGDRIGLQVERSAALLLVRADVSQMENALLSLLVNACDRVSDRANLQVAVSAVRLDAVFAAAHPSVVPGEYVQVAVSSAAGAAGWQADDPRADLFMAQAFAREAGGILLHSGRVGDIVSLRLFLPRFVPPTVMARVRGGGQTTVLVVADDAADRLLWVGALRGLDYDVLEAGDAMEAFRLIADGGGVDLLLTDIGLPGGVGGSALADAARTVDPAMRVLFMAGSGCMGPLNEPPGPLLRRPFGADELAAKVRDVLQADPVSNRSETVQG